MHSDSLSYYSYFLAPFSCVSPQVAAAQRPQAAIRIAESLLIDTFELHTLRETRRADTFTVRSASQLESTAEALIEKLQCLRSEATIAEIMYKCSLLHTSTPVGASQDCRLEHDRVIASALACISRQLASLEDAVACFLRNSRPGAGHHSSYHSGQSAAWVHRFAPDVFEPGNTARSVASLQSKPHLSFADR